MEIFDAHAHYDDSHFDDERDKLLQEILLEFNDDNFSS